jgi:hypothetical protein
MAPKWIPRFDVAIERMREELGSRQAEIRVAEALNEQLPKEVWVLPNLRFIKDKPDRASKSLEIDFLIVWQGRGFIVIEVKGGAVRFNADTQSWGVSRGGRCHEYERSPCRQIEGARTDFCDLILRNVLPLGMNVRDCVESLLVFPDIDVAALRTDSGAAAANVDDWPTRKIVGRRDMNQLGRKIADLLGLTPRAFADVVARLRSSVMAEPSPTHILAQADSALSKATEMQLERIRTFKDNAYVLLSGPAGTGKTIIGLSLVQAWAASGREAFFISANAHLIDGLLHDKRFAAVTSRVLTIAQFVAHHTGGSATMNDEQQLEALVGEDRDPRTGALDYCVVIDEAQDLNFALYEALVSMISYERLWVLLDDRQMLEMRHERCLFEIECMKGAAFCVLESNCRNTKRIAEYVRRLVDIPREYVSPYLPEGEEEPRCIQVADDTSHDTQLGSLIKQYMSRGYPIDSMVVISCLADGPTAIRAKYCDARCVEKFGVAFEYGVIPSQKLRVVSCLDFRGLEAEVVIVCDVHGDEWSFRANYIAATRAKLLLTSIWVKPHGDGKECQPFAPKCDFDM